MVLLGSLGAMLEEGLSIGFPIDTLFGDCFNLLDGRVLDQILRWISKGLIWFLWLAPPCTHWSRARRTGTSGHSSASLLGPTVRILEAATAAD